MAHANLPCSLSNVCMVSVVLLLIRYINHPLNSECIRHLTQHNGYFCCFQPESDRHFHRDYEIHGLRRCTSDQSSKKQTKLHINDMALQIHGLSMIQPGKQPTDPFTARKILIQSQLNRMRNIYSKLIRIDMIVIIPNNNNNNI